MFLRCANPKCSTQFDYRQGQLIRAPKRAQHTDSDVSCEFSHFWLCGECASQYYLEYRDGEGVVMSVRPPGRVESGREKVAAA